MNIIGRQIEHNRFGKGKIVQVDGCKIDAVFSCGEKHFMLGKEFFGCIEGTNCKTKEYLHKMFDECQNYSKKERNITYKDIIVDKNRNYWRYRSGAMDKSKIDGPEGQIMNWNMDLIRGEVQHQLQNVKSRETYGSLEEVKDTRSDNPGRCHDAWVFCKDMRIGDVIVAVAEGDNILDLGIVCGEYEFHGENEYRRHVRKVEWLALKEIPVRIQSGIGQSALKIFSLGDDENNSEVILKKILFHWKEELLERKIIEIMAA